MNSPVERPAADEAATASPVGGDEAAKAARACPIPAPSHPLQFRAIGLVRGRYERSDDKLNQGMLVLEGAAQTAIDAVLLGRTIGVIKNHVDLDVPHLWVVYPRTHPKEHKLQLQVVGIWEPETLKPDTISQEAATAAAETAEVSAVDDGGDIVAADPEAPASNEAATASNEAATASEVLAVELAPKPPPRRPTPPVPRPAPARTNGASNDDDPSVPQKLVRAVPLPQSGSEFSVRGEVVFYSEESEKIVVKIKQSPRQEGDRPKFFKLEMQGKLPTNRALRQFWDLLVQLEGETLIVRDAVSVGPVKPKKKPRPQKPIRKRLSSPAYDEASAAPIRKESREARTEERPRPRRVVEKPRRRNSES